MHIANNSNAKCLLMQVGYEEKQAVLQIRNFEALSTCLLVLKKLFLCGVAFDPNANYFQSEGFDKTLPFFYCLCRNLGIF